MTPYEAKKFRSSAAWKRARRVVLNEEDRCGICKRPVDVNLPIGFDASPEVDHIIPLERGGSPLDRSNHWLTHRICNRRKSNKILNAHSMKQLADSVNSERYRGPEEDWSSIF